MKELAGLPIKKLSGNIWNSVSKCLVRFCRCHINQTETALMVIVIFLVKVTIDGFDEINFENGN